MVSREFVCVCVCVREREESVCVCVWCERCVVRQRVVCV